MKLSLRALREFVDFQGSARELSDLLAGLGFPTDGIAHSGQGLDQVVVGQVLTKKKHPQADRLNLLTVSIGAETLPIVCGAQNMVEGDFVALAPVGARVPGKDGSGLDIKEAKIRGETSKGMCCSLAELALSGDSDGIWILPKQKITSEHLGKKLNTLFDLEDWILDVDVTPNRPDMMSVRGAARELAAKLGTKMKPLNFAKWKAGPATFPIVESHSDCYGFAACHVTGVRYGESPESLRNFVEAAGSRSISNLVDVTNKVLFGLGHPIHFFDAEKVDLQSLQARRAKSGERLTLLGGKTIELTTEDLVIADKTGPLSLAGIMGGEASSVTSSTKSIVIEVAAFNPRLIRTSARRHELSSESSMRFERGLTPHRLDEVMEYALSLVKEVSGFESASGSKVVDKQIKIKDVQWDRSRVEAKIGALKLSDEDVFKLLKRLDYEVTPKGSTVLIQFPWYRVDCQFLEDVMEDVARIIGYEELEKRRLRIEEPVESLLKSRSVENLKRPLEQSFISAGFVEVINLSFSSEQAETRLGFSKEIGHMHYVNLSNPLQADRDILRGRLLPGLVQKAVFNYLHGEDEIRLFETARCFWFDKSRVELPIVEEERLACVWLPRVTDEKKMWASRVDPYFVFKGLVEKLWSAYRWTAKPTIDRPSLHPQNWSALGCGFYGELHPRIVKGLDISGRVFVGEWTLDIAEKKSKYETPDQYPAIDMDVCFVLDRSVKAAEILNCFQKTKAAHVENMALYDEYSAPELGEGKRSLTFTIRYRSKERTLTSDEVKQSHDALVAGALRQFATFGIALR